MFDKSKYFDTILKPFRKLKHALKQNKGPYLFLLPGFLLFGIFIAFPFFYSLAMSFFDWKVVGSNVFVGFQNYIKAFHDGVLGIAFRNTIIYGVVTVPAQIVLGLGIALLLVRNIRGKTLFRIIYYLPVVTSWVIVSLVFKFLFNDQAGFINYLLHDVLHLIPEYINWLSNPWTALTVIIILGVWKGIGWSMVIFLSGLQNIPEQLYEAASIDGANGFQQFKNVTLPLLRPTLTFVVIMLVIGAFKVFISVWIITKGAPLGKTHVVLTWMYTQAFRYLDLGYGAAITAILFVIMFTLAIVQYKLFRRNIQY